MRDPTCTSRKIIENISWKTSKLHTDTSQKQISPGPDKDQTVELITVGTANVDTGDTVASHRPEAGRAEALSETTQSTQIISESEEGDPGLVVPHTIPLEGNARDFVKTSKNLLSPHFANPVLNVVCKFDNSGGNSVGSCPSLIENSIETNIFSISISNNILPSFSVDNSPSNVSSNSTIQIESENHQEINIAHRGAFESESNQTSTDNSAGSGFAFNESCSNSCSNSKSDCESDNCVRNTDICQPINIESAINGEMLSVSSIDSSPKTVSNISRTEIESENCQKTSLAPTAANGCEFNIMKTKTMPGIAPTNSFEAQSSKSCVSKKTGEESEDSQQLPHQSYFNSEVAKSRQEAPLHRIAIPNKPSHSDILTAESSHENVNVGSLIKESMLLVNNIDINEVGLEVNYSNEAMMYPLNNDNERYINWSFGTETRPALQSGDLESGISINSSENLLVNSRPRIFSKENNNHFTRTFFKSTMQSHQKANRPRPDVKKGIQTKVGKTQRSSVARFESSIQQKNDEVFNTSSKLNQNLVSSQIFLQAQQNGQNMKILDSRKVCDDKSQACTSNKLAQRESIIVSMEIPEEELVVIDTATDGNSMVVPPPEKTSNPFVNAGLEKNISEQQIAMKPALRSASPSLRHPHTDKPNIFAAFSNFIQSTPLSVTASKQETSNLNRGEVWRKIFDQAKARQKRKL